MVDDRMVGIVVPIYKEKLNVFDRISLQQLQNVLGKYPICFAAPKSLVFDYDICVDAYVERFDDKFFESTESYSQLMMCTDFYKRFQSFKYILIYQLDAFVFSDRLKEFCAMDFDYIGAPAPKIIWDHLTRYVGNGGLSLRKTKSMLRVLTNKNEILFNSKMEDILQCEDKFFAYCSSLPKLNFKTPTVEQAFSFSIEYDVRHCYRNLVRKGKVPFGCHRWYRDNFDDWWKIIKAYGYRLSIKDINAHTANDEYLLVRYNRVLPYLQSRLYRETNKQIMGKMWQELLPLRDSYSLWGYGKDGKVAEKILSRANIKILRIYDQNIVEQGQFFRPPKAIELLMNKKECIIISTRNHEEEIGNYLKEIGLVYGEDFVSFSVLKRVVYKKYVQRWISSLPHGVLFYE